MKEGSKMRLGRTIYMCMILGSLFMGCNGQKKAAVDNNNNDNTSSDSPLTLVTQGNYAPTDSVETQVITNEKGLTKFFRKINMTRKPGIPIPQVDFSKNLVIIYCAGANGNGTQPELVVANETATTLILGMNTVLNKEKPAATVNPFRIYTMPSTSKKISFKVLE